MKKIIIFILILCSTPLTLLFGASSKLDNPAQPQINPVQVTLVSELEGPQANEAVDLSQIKLKYRGTLLLNSPHPAFGGFSDLLVSKDRKTFLAVSDMGFWLKGSLLYKPDGSLKAARNKAELGQLLNTKGKTFTVKYDADAEALCRAPGSGYLVAFERVHLINRYHTDKKLDLSGKATALPLTKQLKNSPLNGGIETMLLLPDNTLFALTEGDDSAGPLSEAALLKEGKWVSFKYQRNSSYRPTSAGNLNGNKILILERRYDGPGTLGIRFSTIKKTDLKEGAILKPELFCEIDLPIPRDNYEGMDIISDPNGRQWIYIISDDNFSPLQRTLLSLFELNN
ncbi:esterase-like activity of phytase family protein [Marinifilum sp. JC120]|nr:esterase-like activity of phytase family protein [Marinifilum sp. JC120]